MNTKCGSGQVGMGPHGRTERVADPTPPEDEEPIVRGHGVERHSQEVGFNAGPPRPAELDEALTAVVAGRIGDDEEAGGVEAEGREDGAAEDHVYLRLSALVVARSPTPPCSTPSQCAGPPLVLCSATTALAPHPSTMLRAPHPVLCSTASRARQQRGSKLKLRGWNHLHLTEQASVRDTELEHGKKIGKKLVCSLLGWRGIAIRVHPVQNGVGWGGLACWDFG